MITLSEKKYFNLMMVILPLINFLVGISIDIYAPSMPAIAKFYNVNNLIVQNTISFYVIGMAIGCLFWGMIYDLLGRKIVIIITLITFIILNIFIVESINILQFVVIRFIQGIIVASFSVGTRALVADHFHEQKYIEVLLYVSIAYSIGPVIAPFIGGYFQYHYGLKANFYTLAFVSTFILIVIGLFVNKNFENPHKLKFKNIISSYYTIMKNSLFLSGTILLGICQTISLIFPTIGPFLIEHRLNYSSITYGNSALFVGLGYLLSGILNKILLKNFNQQMLIILGFLFSLLYICLLGIFVLYTKLSLIPLVIVFTLLSFSNGFIFSNVMSNCLKIFKKNAGVATSLTIFTLMLISSIGIYIISIIKIISLSNILNLFFILYFMQIFVYWFKFKEIFIVHK